MKNLLKFFALAIISLAFCTTSSGQGATESSPAHATIVGPITITLVRDLNFGNVAASALAGTVILDPIAASTRTAVGGVTLPAATGTVQSAQFTVAGVVGYTYSVAIPTVSVTLSDGTNNMTVDDFTSTPSGAGGDLSSGSETLYVGATLNVNAAQPAGVYNSLADFDVTVNYN